MIVAIDVGNTTTEIGLIDAEQQIRERFRISSLPRTTDELGLQILQLLGSRGVPPDAVDGAIICSVVPSLQYTVEKACRRYLEDEPLVVGRKLKTGKETRP